MSSPSSLRARPASPDARRLQTLVLTGTIEEVGQCLDDDDLAEVVLSLRPRDGRGHERRVGIYVSQEECRGFAAHLFGEVVVTVEVAS